MLLFIWRPQASGVFSFNSQLRMGSQSQKYVLKELKKESNKTNYSGYIMCYIILCLIELFILNKSLHTFKFVNIQHLETK